MIPPIALAATNSITNPSFETAGASSTDAANWIEGTNHTRSSDRFHSGGWALKSTYTGTGTNTHTAAITVAPNTTYTLSGWIYKAATTGSAYIDMTDIPGEPNLAASQTNVWQYVSGNWNSGSTTSVVIRLVTDNGLNGSVWFDDIDFEVASIIPNPSFETAGASSTDAANWTEGTNHTRSSDNVKDGSWALKSTYTGTGTDTHTAAITVAPNTTYTLSGYIWKSTSAGAAYIDMTDIPGELTLRSTQTGVWQFVSGTWNSGTRTSVVIRLVTDNNPTAAIWFDDISFTKAPTNTIIAAGAGDTACDPANTTSLCHHMQTSDLLLQINPDVVLTFGDNQYENGQYANFLNYYDPSWGRVKAKTQPTAGNHEYNTSGATGYYDYFNGVGNANGPAGDRTKGYYSFDRGAWHFIALNSNCAKIGGCAAGNLQYTWLQSDLAAHTNKCTLAYWHHPIFAIGSHYNDPDSQLVKPLLQLLYDNNADLVLNGHDHNYQRWAPQDPNGNVDTARGIREIVVGTGGRDHGGFAISSPNVESRNSDTFGVLKLSLNTSSYDWQFIPEAGKTFTDSGSTACH